MNRRWLGPSLGFVAVVAVTVSACGTAGTSTAGQPAESSSARAAPAGPRGASGTVAALTASSFEVQNPRNGQVTVTFTPSTSFTHTVPATAVDLVVGDCALATGAAAATPRPAVPTGPGAAAGRDLHGEGGQDRHDDAPDQPAAPFGGSQPLAARSLSAGHGYHQDLRSHPDSPADRPAGC